RCAPRDRLPGGAGRVRAPGWARHPPRAPEREPVGPQQRRFPRRSPASLRQGPADIRHDAHRLRGGDPPQGGAGPCSAGGSVRPRRRLSRPGGRGPPVGLRGDAALLRDRLPGGPRRHAPLPRGACGVEALMPYAKEYLAETARIAASLDPDALERLVRLLVPVRTPARPPLP